MSRRALLALLIFLAGTGLARAEDPPAPAAPDLSFDLLDEGKPAQGPSPADLKRALEVERTGKVRRSMLLTHQILGFTMLGTMAATMVLGQLNYHDLYVTGDFSTRYKRAHLGLSISTTALFAGTGLLGLFAPNPYKKPVRFDTALVHKISMIAATAGMVTQLILGPITASLDGRNAQANLALGHLIVGWATLGFTATGVIVYMF